MELSTRLSGVGAISGSLQEPAEAIVPPLSWLRPFLLALQLLYSTASFCTFLLIRVPVPAPLHPQYDYPREHPAPKRLVLTGR
jgi:hypothetical protein